MARTLSVVKCTHTCRHSLTTVHRGCLTDGKVDRPQFIPHCDWTIAFLSKPPKKDIRTLFSRAGTVLAPNSSSEHHPAALSARNYRISRTALCDKHGRVRGQMGFRGLLAEAADGQAPDSGSQDHSCVIHTHTGQGRSRVKRTPWPRGIQRPPEDRGLAPRAKTESKNCSRDTCSTLDKETRKAKGDLSFPAEISFQARGWTDGGLECLNWAATKNPMTLCPGRSRAITQPPSEMGNAGHLWGMLTKGLTVYNS